VVVIILPFNYPLCLLSGRPGSAASGQCPSCVKPSDLTDVTTLKFVEAFRPCFRSPWVSSRSLQGPKGRAAARHHSLTRGTVAFTGGHRDRKMGRADLCGHVQALPDRNLRQRPLHRHARRRAIEIAARGAAFGAYLNCGQVCAAAERFYVHAAIYEEFVAVPDRTYQEGSGWKRPGPCRHGTARIGARAASAVSRICSGRKIEGIRTQSAVGARPASSGLVSSSRPCWSTFRPSRYPERRVLRAGCGSSVQGRKLRGSYHACQPLAYGLGATNLHARSREAMRAVNELEAAWYG